MGVADGIAVVGVTLGMAVLGKAVGIAVGVEVGMSVGHVSHDSKHASLALILSADFISQRSSGSRLIHSQPLEG